MEFVIVDIGCGRRPGGDINIDVVRTPFCNLVASGERLPIRDGCVDLILCSAVLEHLNHPDEALAEINRILKLNGIVHVDFPKPQFTNRPKAALIHFFLGFPFSLYPLELKALFEVLTGVRHKSPFHFHKRIVTAEDVSRYLSIVDIEESGNVLLYGDRRGRLDRLFMGKIKRRFNIGLKLTCKKKFKSIKSKRNLEKD